MNTIGNVAKIGLNGLKEVKEIFEPISLVLDAIKCI